MTKLSTIQKFLEIISQNVDKDDCIKKFDVDGTDTTDSTVRYMVVVIMKSGRYFRLMNDGTVQMKSKWNVRNSTAQNIGKIV